MRILCIIDSFGSGGAQRQMFYLAQGLQTRGHRVELFVYHPEHDFFRSTVERAGIIVHTRPSGTLSWPRILFALTKLIRTKRFDCVISFLNTPNFLSEITWFVSPNSRRVVSERTSFLADTSWLDGIRKRFFHIFATRVVCNSHSHANWLQKFGWLRRKVVTIYNGLPLPPITSFLPPVSPQSLRLLVVGRVGPEKNGLALIEALAMFHTRNGFSPQLNWVGKKDTSPKGKKYVLAMERALREHPEVGSKWRWLGERADIPELLIEHHALVHPSLYEGLPNAICEALAFGRPVLASDVCDHPLLVEENVRGFLFSPSDPLSIADAIEKLASLTHSKWQQMSFNARHYAEHCLSLETMLDKYESLLNTIVATESS